MTNLTYLMTNLIKESQGNKKIGSGSSRLLIRIQPKLPYYLI